MSRMNESFRLLNDDKRLPWALKEEVSGDFKTILAALADYKPPEDLGIATMDKPAPPDFDFMSGGGGTSVRALF